MGPDGSQGLGDSLPMIDKKFIVYYFFFDVVVTTKFSSFVGKPCKTRYSPADKNLLIVKNFNYFISPAACL